MISYRHFFNRYNDPWVIPGGYTMAVDVERKVIGFAFCSQKDQYCKKTGRDLATKRVKEQSGDGSIIIVSMPKGLAEGTRHFQREATRDALDYIEFFWPNTPFGITYG